MNGCSARILLLAACGAALLRGGHGQSATCQTYMYDPMWGTYMYLDGGSCCSGSSRECCSCRASWDDTKILCQDYADAWAGCSTGYNCESTDRGSAPEMEPESYGGDVSGAPDGWDAGEVPRRAGQPYSLCPACTEPGRYIAEGRAGTNCVPCAAGKFTASRTAISCQQCPEGKTSSVSASACEDLPEGAELSRITLSSVSPAACDADTPANACMEDMRLLIEDEKITLYPGLAEYMGQECPTSTGTIDRDSGVASGTSGPWRRVSDSSTANVDWTASVPESGKVEVTVTLPQPWYTFGVLECTGTYLVAEGEVDFGSSSSAVIVVIVVLLLVIGGAIGAFLFMRSKKQSVDVAQNAKVVPPAIVAAPHAQPALALAPSAPAMPVISASEQSVDSLASLAVASKVTKADLATYDLDDIREMLKDERTCPGGVSVPTRKKIEAEWQALQNGAALDLDQLRAELDGLSMKDLRARAVEASVDANAIEEARDSDDPKPAIIGLILAKLGSPGP